MTGRTHDAFAFAGLVTAVAIYPPSSLNMTTAFSCLIGNIVGALIPDMDQASCRLWDLLPAGNYIGRIFRRVFLGHRTLSHSLVGMFLIAKFLQFILPRLFNPNFIDTNLVFVSIMIGFASHLFADSLTRDGIPLLFPFPLKFGLPPISFLRIKTGGFMENFILLPAVAAYIIWLMNENQEKLLSVLKSISSS